MDRIARLFIAPFLILIVTLLGCAAFPGQQPESAAPQQPARSTAKINLPADEQASQSRLEQPSQTPDESTDSLAPMSRDRSVVPDGLLSNESALPPVRNEEIPQTDRIEVVPDNDPFGSSLRQATHWSSHNNVAEGDQPIQPGSLTTDAPAEGLLAGNYVGVSGENGGSTLRETKPAVVAKNLKEVTVSNGSSGPNDASWVANDGEEVFVRSRTIKLTFELPNGVDADTTRIQITIDDQKFADENGALAVIPSTGVIPDEGNLPAASSDTTGFNVTLDPGKSTIITIRGVNESPHDQVKINPFRVAVYAPADASSKPEINKISNGIQAGYVPFNSNDSTPKIHVYGPVPYLRISGRIGGERNLRFFMADGNGVVKQPITDTKVKSVGSYGWEAELRLPRVEPIVVENSEGRILVFRGPTSGDLSHSYALGAVQFVRKDFTVEGTKPTIETIGGISNGPPYNFNKSDLALVGGQPVPDDAQLIVTSNLDLTNPLLVLEDSDGSNWSGKAIGLKDRTQRITARFAQGDKEFERSEPKDVTVRRKGPTVTGVNPSNFGIAPGIVNLTITFDPNNKIAVTESENPVETYTNYYLLARDRNGAFGGTHIEPKTDGVNFDASQNSVTLTFDSTKIPANVYQLNILVTEIKDVFGNNLEGVPGEQGSDYKRQLGGPAGALVGQFVPDVTPTVTPGVGESTGDYVAFPEFVRRPDVESGFNPNDKVETRVVRLYYYRDAHRIAQIVNRKVESYNRAAVKTNRQLADKARNQANQLTVSRQNAERNAIIMASKTRQQENELQRAENSLNGSLQQLTNYRRDNPDANPNDDDTIKQLESLVNSFSLQVNNIQSAVQASRDQEVQANEQAQQAEAREKLAREDQFRREVAAAHSDPDTYAPGKLDSVDPVEQVSVSVVGEGLIQLRGPLKGINLIRTAIDQLDSPVGQVRISLHTIQINGEHADRMEVVAKKVQTYIDHARFLTMQSSEMLRKAVVQVASQKAEEASALFPGATQMDRDERYIVAFFGKDFIDELRAMDSEFLHTGNKLLSLHSMDTTSLASALNLMALAKNSTRQEIFSTFDEMCQTQLPQAEQNYFAAGWTCPKKKKKHLFHRCKDCQPEYCPMACNARFESLRGFFDLQISNDDTMTPLQREFIRLAQIFKSRLVTELEYKQRVMERAIIEERLGNRNQDLIDAKALEDAANAKLKAVLKKLAIQRVSIASAISEIRSQFTAVIAAQVRNAKQLANPFMATFRAIGLKEARKRYRDSENKQGFVPTLTNIGKTNVRIYSFNVEFGIDATDEQQNQNGDYFYIQDANNPENNSAANEAFALTYEKSLKAAEEVQKLLKQLKDWYGAPLELELSRLSTDLNRAPKSVDFKEIEIAGAQDIARSNLPTEATTILAINELDVAKLELVYESIKQAINTLEKLIESRRLPPELERGLDVVIQNINSEKPTDLSITFGEWIVQRDQLERLLATFVTDSQRKSHLNGLLNQVTSGFRSLLNVESERQFASANANKSRRPLDHKKFLDMLVDDLEEKYIELLDGTRAQVANIDNYLKRVTTALDDDFNTQFYYPAFKYIREANVSYDVQFGQFETTTLLANNREFAKADPSATMEFDLPERDILLKEGIDGGMAMMNDIGALASDPNFLAMAKLNSPNSGATPNPGSTGGYGVVRSVLPGLGGSTSEQVMSQNSNGGQQFGSNLENLIPDPAIYKFETGTGFEIRPVIQPDGQAVVFDFNYMYSTEVREPVRADEKHLGRVKRHYVDTDVQLSNFELREVSRYTVALKAARTAKGVPLFEDLPAVGVLFRPLPSDENSLQQNLIMAQATIFPTLFDLMGLRWASVVSDLDPLTLSDSDFIVRNRRRMLENRVYDESSSYVDDFLRVPEGARRMDLYRSQETIPSVHPNGYRGPGMNLQDSQMQEGYQPNRVYPAQPFVPNQSIEGAPNAPYRRPPQEFYDQNQTTAPPNPTEKREPWKIVNPRSR